MPDTTQTLNIIQYNVNKSRNRVMTSMFKSLNPEEHHILAVQEPWRNPQMPTTSRPPNYHLIYPMSKETRVCFYVSKAIDHNKWETTEHSPDLVILTIQSGDRTLHIHNCYNPPPKLLTSRSLATLQLLPQALERPGEHLLVGDFNLHHPSWGGTLLPTQHTLADDLIEAVAQGNMELILPQGTVTWRSNNSMSTLDLSFASPGIAERVLQCQPCEELDSDSDHVPIITSIETTIPQQPDHPAQPQWRKANWEKVREHLKHRLGRLSQDDLLDLGESDRRQANELEALDERVVLLQTIIQDTIRDTIPLVKPSRWIRTGWSDECTESVKRARRARRKWMAYGSQETYVSYRQAVNEKKRQIKRDSTLGWRQTVADVMRDPAKMWRLTKWARTTAQEPPPPPQFPPLKDRHGRLHGSNKGKADVLADHFFPPPVDADLADLAGHVYPPELSMSQEVTAEEILSILKAIAPDKAPGPDSIPNRFLRECREVLAEPLAKLFQDCLQRSYHPMPFRHSKTVVLRKPQKAAYDVAKAYRPIALLNTLGKVLEKIVARRMSALAEDHNLLPTTQMGARPGRSTMTALEMLTEQIQTVWANDHTLVASMLSLDISGAFDNVSHDRLIHNIREAKLPLWVADYIRSFLTDRTTTLMLGTYEDRIRPTTSGIPQGSTLSPILFLFFASTLLPRLNAGATTAIGFVDDTNILTFSRSTEANCRVLERANEKCMAWARTHGATFAPEKYQLMHFTRRPRKFNMQATVRIPKFQDGPVPVMRILGIHLDSKLKLGPHVNLTAAKAASHMTSITRLTKSTWGATFAKARQIYAAVVRPVLSYGCPMWYSVGDERANRNRLIYPLQTVQNKCLRTITGAYKTTNVQVLEHEASIPPLDLHLEMLAINHVQRSKDSAGDQAVVEACQAINRRAQRRFRTKGNIPTRHIDQFQARNTCIQQRSRLAGRHGGKIATKRELEENWKARWTEYQQQTCTMVNDSRLSVAARAAWDRGLRTKENLTRAESTVATLLRTEHIGLNDYLSRRRVPGYAKPDCDCGWPRQTPKHIILFCPAHAPGRTEMLAEARTTDFARLLSTEAGLRAVTRWFLQRDVLTQFSLARTMDETKPRRRGRRPGTYVDEDDGDR